MERFPGRHAGHYEKDFILYVFGLRINKPWKVRSWFNIMKYSYKMRTHLLRNKHLGMLHAERGIVHGSVAVISYWNSFEELEAFARDRDQLHLQGWRWYNTAVHRSQAVGMWHEMYRVPAGHVAGLYTHMPKIGFGLFGDHKPVGSTLKTAAQRLGLREEFDGPSDEVTGTQLDEYEAADRAAAAKAALDNGGRVKT